MGLPDSSFAMPENLISRGTWVEAELEFVTAVWARAALISADKILTTKQTRSFMGSSLFVSI
jgi:hypothetical protein